MPQTTCDTCGASIDAAARFCPECGAPRGEPAEVRTYGKPPTVHLGIGRRLAVLRTRTRALVETLSTQSQARRRVLAIRLELEQLGGGRDSALRDLGRAVYDEDTAGTEQGRAAIRELDDRIAAKEAEMNRVAESTYERVEQTRAESRQTELLEPPAPAPGPPEPYPPAIPEPYPPPDEGTPPLPTPVPEPYPPPDEADPPRQS
jgi:hypothetical protein